MPTPSDELPEVLASGRTDVTTVVVSLSARHPDGRDEEYLAWHGLDHRPEQHRLTALRGSIRLVSTPACRAARLAEEGRYREVDHVMTYLFADRSALGPFRDLGAALSAGGRMPLRLPSVELGVYEPVGMAASRHALVGADVIPWRPALGVYLLIEQIDLIERLDGPTVDPPVELTTIDRQVELTTVEGVAGAWWHTGRRAQPLGPVDTTGRLITYCYLDDDPAATAERLREVIEQRWTRGGVTPLLAAPFHTVVPFDWGRHLP